jgi:hypothetical protein
VKTTNYLGRGTDCLFSRQSVSMNRDNVLVWRFSIEPRRSVIVQETRVSLADALG